MKRYERIKRKHNIKKIVRLIILILILIASITIFILYITKEDIRNWMDINIFRKEIGAENIVSIDLDITKNNQIFAFSKYIAVLSNKELVLYNGNGDKINTIETDINQAVYDSKGKYLALAEEGGRNFSVIFDKNYLWNDTEECEISQIHINENGYLGIISSDDTYKSIISIYDSLGKILFKKYFASTEVMDLTISNDNNYIAIGEVDISGAVIQSNINIFSIEKAINKEDDLIYTYQAERDKLITNVIYQNNNEVVCMYNDSIDIIVDNENKEIFKVNDNTMFLSNELKNNIIYIDEISEGILKKEYNIHIININNLKENIYIIDENIKSIYTKNNVIVANVGTELYFLNNSGWLIKKYKADKEISNISFSDDIVAIIYKSKIQLINL